METTASSLQGGELVGGQDRRKCSATVFRVGQRKALEHKGVEGESKRILGNALFNSCDFSCGVTIPGETLIRFRIPFTLHSSDVTVSNDLFLTRERDRPVHSAAEEPPGFSCAWTSTHKAVVLVETQRPTRVRMREGHCTQQNHA